MPVIQVYLFLICLLILWFSLTKKVSEIEDDSQLLMFKDGVVSKEKFVYFSVEDEGDLRLTLYSSYGDADIYIAENSRVLPTYELEKYDLHAATCGDDVIEIPKSFKRPIIIGIYGNSLSETTRFLLKVDRIYSSEKTIYSDFEEPNLTQEAMNKYNSKEDASSSNIPKAKIKQSNKLEIKTFLFGLLEVLASIL